MQVLFLQVSYKNYMRVSIGELFKALLDVFEL